MNFFKKNQHLIVAAIGILLTVCGVALTIAAAIEAKKARGLNLEDTSIAIEE